MSVSLAFALGISLKFCRVQSALCRSRSAVSEKHGSELNREKVQFFFFTLHIYLTTCLIVCINMSLTKRGSKKLSSDSPEEDFETYVRELLTRLCEGQNKIRQDISSLRTNVQSNDAALVELTKQFTTLNQSFEELSGELHDARCKVDEIESSVQNHTTQIAQMYERLLSLERYSREYNLRFHNIPESPGEDCLQKINDTLANQLNLEPQIEKRPSSVSKKRR